MHKSTGCELLSAWIKCEVEQKIESNSTRQLISVYAILLSELVKQAHEDKIDNCK